jgi:hypothetical protein
MPRYQLRLKQDQSLDGVLDGCVDAVWKALTAAPEWSGLAGKDKDALRGGLKKVLSSYIVRFDTCGGEALCEDSIEPVEWNKNPDPAVAPRRPWEADEVQRLSVQSAKGLEGIIDGLEAEVYREFFRTPERAHRAAAMRPVLARILRDALAPHLYRNVTCGTLELCKNAKRSDPFEAVP